MTSKERENFLRNAILVVDHSKAALVSLVELDLQNIGQTFEQFVNTNQHEIYHLYNSSLCCQCLPVHRPPRSPRILHQSQMELLFDRSSLKLPCHNTGRRSDDFCCSMAKSGLCTDVLDLTLARCLLVNLCSDVFWYSCLQFQSITLEDFLNHNKHTLYHLLQINTPCCQCPPGYTFPTKHSMLYQNDWTQMFNSALLPCTNHRKRHSPGGMQSNCSVAAAPGITLLNLDPSVGRIILQHCCTLRMAVETLVQIRNRDYGHAKEGIMSYNDYNTSISNIERCIIEIAKVCNEETQFKQKLQEAKYGALDQTLFTQYQNNLMETLTRQADIHQSVADLAPTINKIGKKIAEKSGKIPKLMDECVKKGFDYQEQLMEKFNRKLVKVKNEVVPTEIKLMSDKRSVPIYLKLLESGSEKKRDIRLVIVGKKGAGKTSLLKRLFGEELGAVDSTNGIEIHRIKCKTESTDVNWKKIDGDNEESERYLRLLIPYKDRLKYQNDVTDNRTTSLKQHEEKVTTYDIGSFETSEQGADRTSINDNTTLISSEENSYSRTAPNQPVQFINNVTVNETKELQPNLSDDQVNEDIIDMLNSEIDLNDREEYATLLLWDFAGDEEFYQTHQTFLSPDSIYLVVTNLNEADNKDAQGIFRLWMDSIHCYCNPDELSNISNISTNGMSDEPLDPPVILVGTWKDQIQNPVGEEIMDVCKESLYKFAEDVSDDARRHIRDEYTHFVSNTKDDNSAFQRIRRHILQLARTMKTWNTNYPLKVIQLEKRLQEKKKESPIVSFQEIKLISSKTQKPLNDEELMLFLKFHHAIRALVFFDDLSDYIILDTQWLSDAFKCVVTAKKFQNISMKNKRKWDDFFISGKLHSFVLKDMFKKEQHMLTDYKDYILNVMEKFDIIIRPNILDKDTGTEEICYYVPCIIKQKPECDIYAMLNATADTCRRSTWLCFKFSFLPPHLMNHLIASLCRRYEIAEVFSSRQTKNRIALFKGTVVFEVDKLTELQKLLVITRSDLIQMQILEFGTDLVFDKEVYKQISKFVTKEIHKIISTRFKMTTVKFSKMWECGFAQPDSVTKCRDFGKEQIAEYYCGMCRKTHTATDEWSDLPTKSLRCSHHVQESDPLTENKTVISTKVYIKGRSSFSTCVSGVGSSGDTQNKLSKEENNFTKMGMIALNILADVLYDLLKLDGQNVSTRSEYDITKLYNEHRKFNKHMPSISIKRPRGSWGGNWHNIQNTDAGIGDDIERIRLTRNELQHSSTYELDDTRFNELCCIMHDLLGRFEQHNKPTKLYSARIKEILAKNISDEETNNVRQQFECKMDTETAFQIEVLHELN